MIYSNINDFLNEGAPDNVNFCCSNFGAIDLALNLIDSCEKNGFPVFFFAIDERSSNYMSDYCDVINYYEGIKHKLPITQNLSTKYSAFGTKDFWSLNWCGWEISMDILASGRSAIKMDTDIVVNRNFEKDMLEMLNPNEFDLLVQEDIRGMLCAGFSAMHPQSYDKFKNIFCHKTLTRYDYDNRPDQQILRSMVEDKTMKIKLLDQNLYPPGQYYFDHYESIDSICNIVHFNWLPNGKQQKINVMKKHGCWYL
jgi:hypothetical protein